MPLYQQIILTLPKLPKESLVSIFRKHTKTVLDNKGNVRGIENHGVRALPERTRRKYAVTDGSRYFWEARYVSTTFDASPKCLIEIDRMLRNEEGVLRAFTVKHKSSLFRCSSKNYKNPYFETLAASAEDDSTEEDSTEEDSTEEYSTEEYNTDDDSTEEDSAEKNSM